MSSECRHNMVNFNIVPERYRQADRHPGQDGTGQNNGPIA